MNGRPANVERLSCAAKALLAHAFETGAKRADRYHAWYLWDQANKKPPELR
jgi:hypothetical protein